MSRVVLEPSDRQFLDQLHRIGPGTVQEICAAEGITATAVRQRLTRLQNLELVSREMARTGRGRPHYVYQVTELGLRQLGENYSDLALILWREMKGIEERDVRERIVNRIRDAFVHRYGRVVHAESLEQRILQLQTALSDRGFDVEVDQSGPLPILRENNCPYQELANSDPSICELEQDIFQRVLGAEVHLTECCLDGHYCCEFRAGEAAVESDVR